MENERKQYLLAQRLANGPSLIVVAGVVYATVGGKTSVLDPVWPISSRKHGGIYLLHAQDSWAVIEHYTVNGASQIIFIPPEKRMNVSNGRFEAKEVNYQSFVQAHIDGTLCCIEGKNWSVSGQTFMWDKEWGGWKASTGVCVRHMVYKRERCWIVWLPGPSPNTGRPFVGKNAEQEAFSFAASYTEQK